MQEEIAACAAFKDSDIAEHSRLMAVCNSWFSRSAIPRPLAGRGARCARGPQTLCVVFALAVGGFGWYGCAPAASSAQAGDATISIVDGRPFQDLFTISGSLALEERDGVVNVWPVVTLEPGGGFLVADTRTDQVGVYSESGRLERVFGSGTGDEDSLRFLVRAIRLPGRNILVAGVLGSLTYVPERAHEASREVRTPLARLRDVQLLSERELLLIGVDSTPAKAFLHIWDVPDGRIVRSFFTPTKFDDGVTSTFPTVAVARRAGRFAAAYTFSDTAVFFDSSGIEVLKAHIPIEPFAAPPGPSLPPLIDPGERQAWLNQFTLVQDLFWIDDDQLIVQWAKGTPAGMEWGLLQMDTLGRMVWGIAPAPQLLGIRDGQFYFRDPSVGATPNRWVIAKENTALVSCLYTHRSNTNRGGDTCK